MGNPSDLDGTDGNPPAGARQNAPYWAARTARSLAICSAAAACTSPKLLVTEREGYAGDGTRGCWAGAMSRLTPEEIEASPCPRRASDLGRAGQLEELAAGG
jgi:hypothetical protein